MAHVKRKAKHSGKSQRVSFREKTRTRTGKRGRKNAPCAEWRLCLGLTSVPLASQAPSPPYSLAKLIREPSFGSALSLKSQEGGFHETNI